MQDTSQLCIYLPSVDLDFLVLIQSSVVQFVECVSCYGLFYSALRCVYEINSFMHYVI